MSHWKAGMQIDIEELDVDFYLIRGTAPKGTGSRISYLKKQRGGNLLFHGPDVRKIYTDQQAFFDEVGGVKHHIFTHAPETRDAARLTRDQFGAKNWLSERDHGYVHPSMAEIEFASPNFNGRWIPNVKAIPLPGHTPGFTGYVVRLQNCTYLIIGDFVQAGMKGSLWRTAVGHEALSRPGLNSLETLRGLTVDGYLPNKSNPSQPVPWCTSRREQLAMIDTAAAYLKRKFKIKD